MATPSQYHAGLLPQQQRAEGDIDMERQPHPTHSPFPKMPTRPKKNKPEGD